MKRFYFQLVIVYFMHSCPSGLRGSTQVRMYSYSWVQIPLNVTNKYLIKILQNPWRTYHFILSSLRSYKVIEFHSHQGFVADSRLLYTRCATISDHVKPQLISQVSFTCSTSKQVLHISSENLIS